MQGELAVGATVSRRHRRRFLRCCKAGAGASNTRLGRLVFGLRERSEQSPRRNFCGVFAALRGAYRKPLETTFVGHEGSCLLSAAIAVRRCADGPGQRALRAPGARPVLAS